MYKEQFGILLAFLRKEKGISQKEMADRLSVSVSAVSKWEHGKNLPDMTILSSIADILQVSCDDLHHPEKTLERLADPKFQKMDAEEGDKQNTDKRETSKESETETPKNRHSRIVGVSFGMGILVIVAGVFLVYMLGCRKVNFQQACTRYIEDSTWGKVYEIAYVVDGEMTNDSINTHLDEVRETLSQEIIDTHIVKIVYYKSKEDALAWKEIDVGGYIFLSEE